MSIVQFDSQKIEQLLNSATSERQRKMYQALLDKARSQERSSTANKAPETTSSTEKKTQTTTKGKTKTKTKTVKKNQKTTPQSATTEVSTATKQSNKTVTESSPLPPTPETPQPGPSTIDERGKGASKHNDLTRDTNNTIYQAPFSPRAADRRKGPREFDQAPQTKPKSQSKKSKKSKKKQTAVKPTIFQAVGTVIATPYFQDELSYVKINGCEYDLLYLYGSRRQAYIRLKEDLEKNGSSQMFLRLYPKATFDYQTSQPRLSFSLVNFSRDCEKINDEPQGFMLRGIWQYIPHCKTPVITIYRNHQQKVYFKNLSKSQQLAFAQPRHIPVVWDAPVEPFKFNPQAEKDSQMPRYFVEVRAIFKDGLFVIEEMLREPTLKIPRFIKVSKSSATT